jgi:superfamily II DNA/RNA helicase
MVIAARTGQGKTLCFGIPILDIIVRHIEKHDEIAPIEQIKALIMAPTRELAI